MADFQHPFLVLQGLADTVTDPALAQAFHDMAASEVGGGERAFVSRLVPRAAGWRVAALRMSYMHRFLL